MTADQKINLISCLLLYQVKQDKALGLDYITTKQRGLLWYYQSLRQDLVTKTVTAAYLNNIIQKTAGQIKVLVKRAEKAKDKHKVARKVLALQEIVNKASNELQKISSKE